MSSEFPAGSGRQQAMFENDSIHAFQRSTPKRSRRPNMVDPNKRNLDNFIMDTNNSSIVSKRSVEKLYYAGEPEYFRYFVNKFKRRSPLINRGYWLRMRAVEHTVQRFLLEPSGKRKVVINLGSGYDPLPWLFLGKQPEICRETVFVDVDYPQLMCKKVEVITKTEQLCTILPRFVPSGQQEGLIATSDSYLAIGCDLRNLDLLTVILRERLNAEHDDCSIAILFVAEVSIAYMDYDSSQEVLRWASHFEDVRFCLLEQHLPGGSDHPFAQTMLKHFEKLRTPLRAIGKMEDVQARFETAGWLKHGIDIRSLWDLWSDRSFIDRDERQRLNQIEPFDEWEEFALFANHYFLLVARKEQNDGNPSEMSGRNLEPDERNQKQSSNIKSSSNQDELGHGFQVQQLPEPHDCRRFSAALTADVIDQTVQIGLHAGLGVQERQTDCATYGITDVPSNLQGPPLSHGLMCHTITRLHDSEEVLLVGGRTSPDVAFPDCWLRQRRSWRQVQSLPKGRYRHCAVPVLTADRRPGVLVYGGKSSAGLVLDSWLLWSEACGWQELAVNLESHHTNGPAARFGATISTCFKFPGAGDHAVLMGGMADDGTVLDDIWSWSFDSKTLIIHLRNETEVARHRFGALWPSIPRLGASLVQHDDRLLLIGGVAGSSMLTLDDEVVDLDNSIALPVRGLQPLLVGHTAVSVREGILLIGGGATCFSFGTHWNPACLLRTSAPLSEDKSESSSWHLLRTQAVVEPYLHERDLNTHVDSATRTPSVTAIERLSLKNADHFQSIVDASRPVVITGHDIGRCRDQWTNEYLKQAIGVDREVVVHSSPTKNMDFQTKNFRYKKRAFGSFLDAVDSGEKLYLRALSRDAPSEQPTNLAIDFPEIAGDFELPPQMQFVKDNAHSSPLRISGPVTMWLHYDVMANVLCQVRGKKRLLLFPPSDVMDLNFEAGASSSSLDVFAGISEGYDGLANTHPHETVLEPGDVLYIPALWLHTAEPTDGLSVAVNVFFRHLEKGYAAGRDVYGNRDLAAYEKGRRDIAKIVKTFDGLPIDMRRFYVKRLAAEMLQLAPAKQS